MPLPENDNIVPMVLIPFVKREALTLKEAAEIAGKSEGTVRNWCIEWSIGRRVGGGSWQVSKVALAMFLEDDNQARDAYLAGERAASNVAAYFVRAGLTDLIQTNEGTERNASAD